MGGVYSIRRTKCKSAGIESRAWTRRRIAPTPPARRARSPLRRRHRQEHPRTRWRRGPPAGSRRYGGPVPPGGWNQPIPQPLPFAGRYASWWSRVGAAIIDAIIVTVPAILLGAVIFGGAGAAAVGDETAGVIAFILGTLLYVAIVLVMALLYAPLLMKRAGRANGQTWGKQALRIRVVRADGRAITFGFATLREVVVKGFLGAVAASFTFGIANLLDVLWPLWDDQNRALHDMVVNTRVIKASSAL